MSCPAKVNIGEYPLEGYTYYWHVCDGWLIYEGDTDHMVSNMINMIRDGYDTRDMVA